MELLSQLLSLIPVAGRLDVRCHFGAPWRLDHPVSNDWEIPYHVLLSGDAVLEDGKGPALHLAVGDVVLFPSGEPHTLRDGSDSAARAFTERNVDGLTIKENNGDGTATDVLCGRFLLPAVPLKLMRDHLPGRLLVHTVAGSHKGAPGQDAQFVRSRLARVIELMREEAYEQRAASETVVNQLSAALFALILRSASESDEPPRGLLALAQRPRLQPALAAMFNDPGEHWTMSQLASLCHLSRATFARHFEEALGCSASDVLTEIRMTLAGRKLDQTNLSVADIGESVGYQSEAAFQRMFKRQVGITPAQWRARARRRTGEESAQVPLVERESSAVAEAQ